jgi:hypothetical protein
MLRVSLRLSSRATPLLLLRATLPRRQVQDHIPHRPDEPQPEPHKADYSEDKSHSYRRIKYAQLFSFRGYQGMFVATCVLAAYFMVWPYLEMYLNYVTNADRQLLEPDIHLPHIGMDWWVNQWRKGLCEWRKGESFPGFHVPLFKFIEDMRGVDMLALPAERCGFGLEEKQRSKAQRAAAPCKALVPMSGDSPVVKVLAEHGYETHAVDSCDVAVRYLFERLDAELKHDTPTSNRIKLHFADVMSPKLWRQLETHSYDLIYDRQGLASVDPSKREDYAYILKRALKPDGVIYVEGCFRTAKVPLNHKQGPPFNFGRPHLEVAFAPEDDWVVECAEVRDIKRKDLSPEAQVTGRIPDELHAMPFPCAVWQDALRAAEVKEERKAAEFAAA